MARFIDELKRTHDCGALRSSDVGREVVLFGWVANRRDHGSLIFVDLRDRGGITQIVFDPENSAEAHRQAEQLRSEWVIGVRGRVKARGEQFSQKEGKMVSAANPLLPTGEIEVEVLEVTVFNRSETPPFELTDKLDTREEVRLQYRYLDLRRAPLQKALRTRHVINQATRNYLSEQGCTEVETPFLVKYTPGGARNFLVPSRIHHGKFYALAESPQLFKQLLMVAGFERYFQIVRCFRDEDSRLDRQPEFTQIDLEASFVSQQDVQDVIEAVLVALWQEAGHEIPRPFPRMAYAEAMERFGIDKPDLRFGFEIRDLTPSVGADAAPFVHEALAGGGRLRGIVVAGGAECSRKEIDGFTAAAKDAGAGGLIWCRRTEAGWEGQGVKAIGATALERLDARVGDLLLAVPGPDTITSPALHNVRAMLCRRPGVTPMQAHAFCWIVDFPLFELDPETQQHMPAHHPFTSPHADDFAFLESEPGRCRAQHYDAVYNGIELGSGSIRITDPQLQATIFRLLGIAPDEVRRRFGFLLDGLAAGAPPHGGFAIGFDRVAMLLAGAPSLRDVVAFPKTTAARALFEGAPVAVHPKDLEALHLAVTA